MASKKGPAGPAKRTIRSVRKTAKTISNAARVTYDKGVAKVKDIAGSYSQNDTPLGRRKKRRKNNPDR
ncbi:MAG TPA: hypothetical protein VNI54_07685 [Thermoanaerobaculia bacterium]|nr:hypothetical protein [Thermoanaerobaculia bacterium]